MALPDSKSSNENNEIDMHGAAIIDENGNEIPITSEMIECACDDLAKHEVLCPQSKEAKNSKDGNDGKASEQH